MTTFAASSHMILRTVLVLLTALILPTAFSNAQRRNNAEEEAPVFREYRGVQLGMTVEETRKKLGSPKEKSDQQDDYVFNDLELAQIRYDNAHKVSVLSVDYLTGAQGVPTAKAVMGSNIEAKADGSMYKMVRYIKAGFWVSYSRTGGDSPMVSVTIQKIE
jgi:hypothetical protein